MGWMSQLCGENENDYIEVHKKHYSDLIEKSKELEVYKKSLELLAEDSANPYHEATNPFYEDKQDLINYYLQKARE